MNTRKEYLQQTLTKEALYATCHDYHRGLGKIQVCCTSGVLYQSLFDVSVSILTYSVIVFNTYR